MIMLFWETLQCNKRFRSFIIDTDRAHDFVVLVLFYAMDQRNDPTKQGLIRMCIFVLQTMSVEPNFGRGLNKAFEGQETLPPTIRVANFHGTYADYLVTVSRSENWIVMATTDSCHSQFIHCSLPVKENWMRSIQLSWLSSTTLLHTYRTLAALQALN
jgi:hypothetical protein